MLKKIIVVVGGLLLSSCGLLDDVRWNAPSYEYNNENPLNTVDSTDLSRVDLGDEVSFRVAMLLPLSGKVEAMGNSMKNAAMMAVGDLNNNNLVVQFYDTKGTSSGARIAVENAINEGSQLILGPLMSDEVAAVSEPAKGNNVPVISFSTAPNVLQKGIYSFGLLNEDQIARIIKYAATEGRLRLALTLPDNQSGFNMFKAAMNSAHSYGVTIVKVGFYSPETMDFTQLVTEMAGPEKVKASQMKPEDLKKLKQPLEPVGLDFDALLVPEYGNRLKSLTSMFSFYDVSAPEVLFLGTSVWANTNLNKETELYGAAYPVMSLARLARFSQKYNEMFGEKPNGLSILAYDAVALASALSHKNTDVLHEAITASEGYYGMSGAFRIFENGKNEHAMDVVKVTAGGQRVVDAAPNKFVLFGSSYGQNEVNVSDYEMNMPQIIGKDAEQLKQLLINAQ